MSSPETLPSRLLPDILEKLANASPLMVLDVGQGVGDTVRFFGQAPCRLHFPGLYDCLQSPPEVTVSTPVGQVVDTTEADAMLYEAWLQRFQAALTCPPDTYFDLCLLWDYTSYLDDIALRAFGDALTPYLKPSTLAHSYFLLKDAPEVLNRQYGVLDRDQIVIRPRKTPSPRSYPRPQGRVISMLRDFTVSHSVLRRDGLLEVSLKAEPTTAAANGGATNGGTSKGAASNKVVSNAE